jgi:hypothetical protein
MPAKALTTRRAALASFASAGALIVPTVAVMAAPVSTTQLLSLIEVHRVAREAFDASLDADAVEASDPDGRTLIPTLGGAHYSADQGHANISDRIERDFAAGSAGMATLSKLSPALWEEVRTMLEAKKALCLARLNEVFADHLAAEAASLTYSRAEDDAVVAICAHRCATMEEAAIKFQYLRDWPAADELQPDQIEALLGSFLPEGVGEAA